MTMFRPICVRYLVQLLMVEGGGVDRLQGNKIEQSWTLALEQVRKTILIGAVLLTHNQEQLHCTQFHGQSVGRVSLV